MNISSLTDTAVIGDDEYEKRMSKIYGNGTVSAGMALRFAPSAIARSGQNSSYAPGYHFSNLPPDGTVRDLVETYRTASNQLRMAMIRALEAEEIRR